MILVLFPMIFDMDRSLVSIMIDLLDLILILSFLQSLARLTDLSKGILYAEPPYLFPLSGEELNKYSR